MRSKATTAIGAALLLVLPLSACGGDDSDAGTVTTSSSTTEASSGGGEAGSTVSVEAKDSLKFNADDFEAHAGDVEFVYKNDGNIVHTLVIEGVKDFKLTVSGQGDKDTGDVALEPGTYTLYCDIAGHRNAGMKATLKVNEPDAG